MSEEIKDVENVAVEQPVVEENKVMEQVVRDPNAPVVTLKTLLEAGVHYGHQTRKWNPKMGKYIYCPRNGIYIIDLNKTKSAIDASYAKLKEIVSEGGKVLFVGTKPQAKPIIENEAIRSGSFFVVNRWLGGVLTNFKTIQLRIKKLKELEAQEIDGSWDNLTKKEVIQLKKLKEKLTYNLDGIKEMRRVPNALIVVDPVNEHNAIREALKLRIPVFALCDTNCDPDNISYVIPSNDDATKSIQLLVGLLTDAIVEAKGGLPTYAHLPETGDEATMDDALRQADRENALRMAAKREMQREKMEKEKARKEALEARFHKNRKPKATKDEKVEGEAKIEETKVEEKPAEEVKEEKAPKKRATKKADKAEETKVEEKPAEEAKEEKAPKKRATKKATKEEKVEDEK